MQYNPKTIIVAPTHQSKFVGSLKTNAPKTADTMKFEAVEITVGTKVLESLEWRPFTKYLHTMAFEISIRMTKKAFCHNDVVSWKQTK